MKRPAKLTPQFWRRSSVWIVAIAGTLCVVFFIAIVRELVQGHQVRLQIKRLQTDVATAQKRHDQLQDLIGYLSSPTFQESEARLKLGLKKDGERVIVVPSTNDSLNVNASGDQPTGSQGSSLNGTQPIDHWWNYFFGSHEHRPNS